MVRVLRDDFPKGYYAGQKDDGYSFDAIMQKNMDYVKRIVLKKKIDYCIAVDGKVGIGKSTLAFQYARYLDRNFNLDKVAFTPSQFIKILQTAEKGNAIVLDEAVVIGSRFAMSEFNKKIMVIMAQIRSKQLFIFFVLPSCFDLDRNLILYRANLLLHCYSRELGERGYYSVYNEEYGDVTNLYLNGKKFYSYAIKPSHYGTFSKCFVLDENEYEKKKREAIETLEIGKSARSDKFKEQRDNLIRFLREKDKKSYPEIVDAVGSLSNDEIGKICRGER